MCAAKCQNSLRDTHLEPSELHSCKHLVFHASKRLLRTLQQRVSKKYFSKIASKYLSVTIYMCLCVPGRPMYVLAKDTSKTSAKQFSKQQKTANQKT